jgi:hypothetical protein
VISGKRQINLGLARHLAKHGELKVKADAPLELKQAIFTKLRNAWPMSLLTASPGKIANAIGIR